MTTITAKLKIRGTDTEKLNYSNCADFVKNNWPLRHLYQFWKKYRARFSDVNLKKQKGINLFFFLSINDEGEKRDQRYSCLIKKLDS